MNSSSPPSDARTYDLQLSHVTADGGSVDASSELVSRTAVPEPEVLEMLHRFAQIPPIQLVELDPQITIRGTHAQLQVRPDRGRLLVCDLGTADRVWREMSPTDVVVALQPAAAAAISAESEPAAVVKPVRSRRWPLALLLVGLALNGYALVSLFFVRPGVEFVPAGDGRPPKEVLETMTGSYTAVVPTAFTRIELRPPNTVVFHDSQTGRTETDTYLYGNYNGQPRLITGRNGFIDLPDRRSIEFAGRRYERESTRP